MMQFKKIFDEGLEADMNIKAPNNPKKEKKIIIHC